ncbi:MAG: CbiQ family ECF transporter T component [Fusobacterium gastrosuis]|uniref:CbiQ family ECF transporter T component n=1 Tax=Fusobacterium TaxID=848 RepID=UPI0025C04588|nr:CbiQ family ECF transporter T component [Fusobacterium sp.]MDD7392410.1 CbiQ family ECF transporter T component [Fusobacteriaceae bacterium]MDY4010574.1 CbiQ family ECF transporter T component [Fusobacterium gastrosuis]MCI5725038.1 energy-coupling factor transporter transmembrane protein EcfT [Fusobacterium sp.]MCI7223264.1 energy-coupling factor transporter transmembrane protein EcfT [Fusobacterium sp.]MDD7409894.1 CbiQ family ECF transporter T component [Fusobacteriaceae bacterium]
MLLKSSLFILLIANIFLNNLKLLIIVFLFSLTLNIFYNKDIKKHLKRMKVLIFFYISTFLVQLYYSQEGKVLYKFFDFYITQEGLLNFGLNFIRIINLILLSWLLNEMKIFKGRFSKYQKIIELVIELVPQVFILVKKRMNARMFYRHVLKKVRTEYNKEV